MFDATYHKYWNFNKQLDIVYKGQVL